MKTCMALALACFIFYSCKTEAEKAVADIALLTDSTSIYGFDTSAVKLVKSAAISIKVADVEKGMHAVTALSRQMGGAVFHQRLQRNVLEQKTLQVSDDSVLAISTTQPAVSMQARVPAQNLDSFLYAAATLGYATTHQELNIDDKSLSYLHNNLKAENRRPVQQKSALSSKAADINNHIRISDEIAERQIENLQTNADAAYSLVQLNLAQNAVVNKEMMANTNLASYALPLQKRMANALQSGWQAFINFTLALVSLWLFLIAGLLGWWLYHVTKRKKMSLLLGKG